MSEYFLTQGDVDTLRRVVDMQRNAYKNTITRHDEENVNRSTEVYVALPPSSGGIPARSGVTPGSAICNICRISRANVSSPYLLSPILKPSGANLTLRVYNIYLRPVPSTLDYIRIIKEKGGRWLCDYPSETELVRFEMIESLSLTGHGKAQLMVPSLGAGVWEAADPVVEIEVYDPYRTEGMWRAAAGYQGFACARGETYTDTVPDPDEVRECYDVVWVEQIAKTIQFTTTEYMGDTTAGRVAVTVDWFDHQGKDPGSVIARDDQGQFPDVPAGAVGTAEYDYHGRYYRIISCQRVVRFAKMLLNGACCGTSTATVDGFVGRPQGDDVLDPPTIPTTVNNPRGHAGLDNDEVLVMRINNDVSAIVWEIVDVDLHELAPITTVEISGGVLQFKTKTIYAEQCDTAESSPTTIAATTECE